MGEASVGPGLPPPTHRAEEWEEMARERQVSVLVRAVGQGVMGYK